MNTTTRININVKNDFSVKIKSKNAEGLTKENLKTIISSLESEIKRLKQKKKNDN